MTVPKFIAEPSRSPLVATKKKREVLREMGVDRFGMLTKTIMGSIMISLHRICYSELNGRQQENYNFVKFSAVLADYGFVTTRLTADWQGADFIAHHIDGETFVKVQLKGRMSFAKKYMCKDIYIAFPWHGHWYFYPHDELLEKLLATTTIGSSDSWKIGGDYHFPKLSCEMQKLLEPYQLVSSDATSQ